MDAKLKQKWVKALRSGKYKQTKGMLYRKTTRSYCCLGVLARVQGAVVKDGCLRLSGEDVRKRTGDDQSEILSSQYTAGLPEITQNQLAAMNDARGEYRGERKSFKQIADYIEENL